MNFADLLDTIGYSDTEHVSINWQHRPGDRQWNAYVVPVTKAAAAVDAVNDNDRGIWFGVNPIAADSITPGGRGTANDVTRLAALYADLDYKDSGCGGEENARAIIDDLAALVGSRPSAIVSSGHGLQPYWPVEDGARDDAGKLIKRWGALVKLVADRRGAKVDGVYEIARVMRVPGTTNVKAQPFVLATCEADTGSPLGFDEIAERLDEAGIPAAADEGVDVVMSAPSGWRYAELPCDGYTPAMLKGWQTDNPSDRHPWLLAQATRIACCHRYGCFTAETHRRAVQVLDTRFRELLTRPGEQRSISPREVEKALEHGQRVAAVKSEAGIAEELGAHVHLLGGVGYVAAPKSQDTQLHKAEHVTTEDKPRIWRADELQPAAQPRWLAASRLMRGGINLLIGDEGIGKSLLWVWVAAAVTTGKPLQAFGIPPREAADVLLVITEDDWSTTVLPRLIVAGADLGRVHVICVERDGSGAPMFPRDIHLVAEADPVPALVVVDAWLDTVSNGLSVRDPQQARQALHPWREVATATDAAVLLITHTNRVPSGNPRDRYGATGELRKKARLTLFAQQDDEGRLLVGPEKANTAAAVPASMFTIEAVQHFDATDEHDGTVPRLVHAGDSLMTAREYAAAAFESRDEDDEQAVDAWLRDFLGQGSVKATEVYSAADAAGHSKDKAKRAKKRMGVDATYEGTTRVWWWSLPEQGSEQGSASTPVSQNMLPCSLAPSPQVTSEGKGAAEGARAQGSKGAQIQGAAPLCDKCGKTMAAGQVGSHLGCRSVGAR